jgi:hypothetical protein
LDPAETQVEQFSQRFDYQRLGKARDARQQAMASGEYGREKVVDNLLLARDDIPRFSQNSLARISHLRHQFFIRMSLRRHN